MDQTGLFTFSFAGDPEAVPQGFARSGSLLWKSGLLGLT
jgi:hypothetical protein